MKDNKMTCDYCAKMKNEMKFFIGYAPIEDGLLEWIMWEGTGKMSCNSTDCYIKAETESQAVLKSLTK